MKKKYFTHETIKSKAEEFLRELRNLSTEPKLKYEKQNSALLVIDMQNFFSESTSHAFISSFESIIQNILNLIGFYNRNNLPVIFTRHVNSPENAGLMGQWWKNILTEDNELSCIINEFDTTSHTVIRKTQYDAFYNTNLEEVLRKLGVKKLVITGVMAHLCCETTARSAFVRGFENFFVIDGTATYNETFHRATLLNLSHGFSVPVLTEEILNYG